MTQRKSDLIISISVLVVLIPITIYWVRNKINHVPEQYTIEHKPMVIGVFKSNDPLDNWIRFLCHHHGIDEDLVFSILFQENPTRKFDAINRSNANGSWDYGLWQLNGDYFDITTYDWKNPFDNTELALLHIAWLTRQDLNRWEIAAAYNCGLGRVRRTDIPASTIRYANDVLRRIEQ